MHKVMYTILLLISTLGFCQEAEIEMGSSEVFNKLLNLHKIASEEKHSIDYYSVQIYNGNYKDADSIYNFLIVDHSHSPLKLLLRHLEIFLKRIKWLLKLQFHL